MVIVVSSLPQPLLSPCISQQKYFGNVTLKNTGTVMAEWSFVPKPDELCVSQPFIKFLPQEGG
ncbi:hypothetical protein EON63_14015 [archaeon]|nr:MAG: hypothetical protein EON63_14015 [archaeon]